MLSVDLAAKKGPRMMQGRTASPSAVLARTRHGTLEIQRC